MRIATPSLRHLIAVVLLASVASAVLWLGPAQALLPAAAPDRANSPPLNTTCNRPGCHTVPDPAPQGGGQGSVQVLDIPECYQPGQTYTLKVKVTDTEATRQRWGFEVGVQFAEGNDFDNRTAGTLANAANARTRKVTSNDGLRDFITHDRVSANGDGTYAEQANGAEWEFQWTAPTTRVTPVRVYVAGLAGDNTGARDDDYTYTQTYTINPCVPVPNRRETWGGVKRRYGQ